MNLFTLRAVMLFRNYATTLGDAMNDLSPRQRRRLDRKFPHLASSIATLLSAAEAVNSDELTALLPDARTQARVRFPTAKDVLENRYVPMTGPLDPVRVEEADDEEMFGQAITTPPPRKVKDVVLGSGEDDPFYDNVYTFPGGVPPRDADEAEALLEEKRLKDDPRCPPYYPGL